MQSAISSLYTLVSLWRRCEQLNDKSCRSLKQKDRLVFVSLEMQFFRLWAAIML